MTGHVFHPGHHQLHGITVVLDTTQRQVYIGRFDREDESGVHLIGVSVLDPADGPATRADFISRTAKFGVRVDRSHILVPSALVGQIVPLGDVDS